MEPPPPPPPPPQIYILRHGEALHNIHRGYPHRDPPLTAAGHIATRQITLPFTPDLILISPLTRTLQTALNAFPSLLSSSSSQNPRVEVQIWPSLREAHPAVCNIGSPRSTLSQRFPQFGFSACPEDWDSLPPHSVAAATARAEEVRREIREVAVEGGYRNVVVVTHRGFIAFLVRGGRFGMGEGRGYRFLDEGEDGKEMRFGVNVDTGERQDFGPTVLVEVSETQTP